MAITAPRARIAPTPIALPRPAPSRRGRSRRFLTLRILVAAVVTVVMAFPLWIMLITAFSGRSTFADHLELWPRRVTVSNFSRVMDAWPISTWFVNSCTVTFIITILTVALSLLAGFAFAKLRWPLKTPLFLLMVATVMIPTQAILVPQFKIVNALNLVGTFWAVIIPGVGASTYGVFLARQFMLAIPTELLEAARMDGAGNLRAFVSIVLPLCKPLMAVLTLLSLMYQWNDFLWPLIVLKEPSLYTLPIGLQFLTGQYTTDYGALMAMTLLASLPLIVLFLAFQRFFIQGFATSGLK